MPTHSLFFPDKSHSHVTFIFHVLVAEATRMVVMYEFLCFGKKCSVSEIKVRATAVQWLLVSSLVLLLLLS